MSRRADLKTGYDCNSNCVFCVIGDKLFTGNRPFAACVDELRASRATCDDVVFTGAEVTIRPDFFALIAAAKKLGYRNIQIQTNGRMFAYPEFCKKAVAAGANEFSPSIHGDSARLHDGLTRAAGSFDQIVAAIRNLRALGQRVITNTVATKQNMRRLPALARLLIELGVDQFQIAFPHPTGHAHTYFNGVVPRMSALAPFVVEALELGRAAGVACMAEAIPFCLMPGYERHVAELHIPPTEIVYDGFVVPDYARDRVERGKTRFAACASCRFEPICEGPWREYPEQLGSDEFRPVAGARVIDTAIVLDDRFAMLGGAAPLLPRPADDRARWLALAFFPEAGSAACTTEARSLEAGRDALAALGIAVISINPDDPARLAAMADALALRFALHSDETSELARAYRVIAAGRFRRSTYLLGPASAGGRRIDHVIVAPDVARHAEQICEAVARLSGPPRPLARGEELVVIRRAPKPAQEVAAALDLTADHERFRD
jgi:cyclic pyranopterin phosphate synthase